MERIPESLKNVKEYQMLDSLFECDAFEIGARPGLPGVYDVPYMLNDALECYLVFTGAVMQGEFREDPDVSADGCLTEDGGQKGLIIHQGKENTCTLWYEEVHQELALYRHHEIGHFWESGAEQWRRLVYIIGTMQDKYLFMDEEVCNQEELELIPLMDFSPFHRYFPATSYAPEEYVTTDEGCRCMMKLAEESGDSSYRFWTWVYLHIPNGLLERQLHRMLMSSRREKLYDRIVEKCKTAGMQYPERDYGTEKNAIRRSMREELHQKMLEHGFRGDYPDYQKGRIHIQVAEEHPFTRMEEFTEGFRLQLMVSEAPEGVRGQNRGFFRGKGRKGRICSPEEFFGGLHSDMESGQTGS